MCLDVFEGLRTKKIENSWTKGQIYKNEVVNLLRLEATDYFEDEQQFLNFISLMIEFTYLKSVSYLDGKERNNKYLFSTKTIKTDKVFKLINNE